MNKLCFIFNTPSLYRKLIYTRMDKEFDCDWYFGDWNANVKGFDTACLRNPVNILHVSNPGGSRYATEGLVKLLRDKRYDKYLMIGDAHDTSTWRMLIAKCLFNRKKKIYFWTHGWYGKESGIEKLVKSIFYKMVDGVFLYGHHAEEIMAKEGFDREKLFVIHNSLDYDTQLELREKIRPSSLYQDHFCNENKNIIFLGRLTAVKRFDLLLNAVKKLKDDGELYNVTFVGDGVERTNMENMVENLGLNEQVWFYGACYDEVKNAEFVYNADLCVSPGNVGLTAMHMLMFGTPVITHDNFALQMPEFEAIIPYKTGLFFRHDDANDLCEKIKKWFKQNGGFRDTIRKNCYHEIDTQWTPDFQLNVLHSVLDN